MSIRVMTRVWESADVRGSQLLCLLALADWCDDAGTCRPSYAVLAKKMRVSRRTAISTVKQLADDGHLKRRFRKDAERGNRSNVLTLDRYAAAGSSVEDIREQHQGATPSEADDTTPSEAGFTTPGEAGDTTPSEAGFTQIRHVDTSIEDTKKKHAAAAASTPPRKMAARKSDPHFEALASICGLQTKRLTRGNRAQLGKHAASLREDGVGPEFIQACGESWYTDKFGWKERSDVKPPTVSQAAEWVGQKWASAQARRSPNVPRPYLMPNGRLKPVTSLLRRSEFKGVEPGDPNTYPAAYKAAAEELGVRLG